MKIIFCPKSRKILVDDKDYDFLCRLSWRTSKSGKGGKTLYAFTDFSIGETKFIIPMHRLIMGMKKKIIDHVDQNGLNNQRKNLRFCYSNQNSYNKPVKPNRNGYRGVTKRKDQKNKFVAVLRLNRKAIYGPSRETAKLAALDYDRLAIEYHGEFATLNFPNENFL